MPSETTVESYRRALGLRPGATVEDVRRQHRRRMRSAHPDVGGSEERAKILNEARDFLLRYPELITVPPRVEPTSALEVPANPVASREAKTTGEPQPAAAPTATPVGGTGLGGFLGVAVLGWVLLLTLATVGWIATAFLPWATRILGY